MKCYNHTETEAVATCMGCGKALCMECCFKNVPGIVCSSLCEDKVNEQNEIIKFIRKKTLTQNKVSGIFSIIAGAIFILFGIFQLTRENYFFPLSLFCIALGFGLIIGGTMFLGVAKSKNRDTQPVT